MMVGKSIQFYVKTTATCNLNCRHCFTSGNQGPKVYFNPVKTAEFVVQFTKKHKVEHARLLYHGGEPMLAQLEDLQQFYHLTREQVPGVQYGIQTNLVYPLTDEKIKFFDQVFMDSGMGTSWDSDIRFGSTHPSLKEKQLALWEQNVRRLVELGHSLTLMVSLSKSLLQNHTPSEIIQYAIDLGFKYILFERITSDGNAQVNESELSVKNIDLDRWIFQMHQDTRKYEFHKKIGNMFLEELALAVGQRLHTANRCRGCEQKLITINADGTLAGCPNSASQQSWGHIDRGVDDFTHSTGRVGAICKEKVRNANCYSCDLADVCNGDCYKLAWNGDLCAAPKTLMRYLKNSSAEEVKTLLI